MKRVLIVEDSAVCREILAARLCRAPCRAAVFSAGSFARAYELVHAEWDLVVLDLDLGGEDARPLLSLIRCQVVLCTGSPEFAPAGYRVIAKGPRWAADIERIVMGLP